MMVRKIRCDLFNKNNPNPRLPLCTFICVLAPGVKDFCVDSTHGPAKDQQRMIQPTNDENLQKWWEDSLEDPLLPYTTYWIILVVYDSQDKYKGPVFKTLFRPFTQVGW